MGRWRIVWLGDIAYQEPARTQPSITVVLESIGGQGFARVTETRVPIAQLFALRLGSVWQDKVLTDEVDTERTSLRVKFKTWKASTRPAGASVPDGSGESFLLPFETHPFHRDHTKSSCLTVEVDGRIVVFPAIELIRFYFGSSGSLLRKLFSANFEPGMLVEHFSIDERRKASVILADDIAAASAQDVARIVLNEHAGAAARLISRSLVAGRAGVREDVKVYVKAALPFAGDADLTIEGVEIPVAGGPPRFLVHELVQCRARFPFSALEYVASSTRRNTSTLRESEIQADGSTGASHRVASRRSAGQIESREPRATSTRQIRADSRGRFPDLESKAVWRSEADVPGRVDVRAQSAAPFDSTGRGAGSAEGKRVDLTRDNDARAMPSTMEWRCDRGTQYLLFLAMLAEQEWVESLAFPAASMQNWTGLTMEAHLGPTGPSLHSWGDGAARGVPQPLAPIWASLAQIRVRGVTSLILSASRDEHALCDTVWLFPSCDVLADGLARNIVSELITADMAERCAIFPLGGVFPWQTCVGTIEAIRAKLSN